MIDLSASVLAVYYPKQLPLVGTKQFYILKTSFGVAKGNSYLLPKVGQMYTFTGEFTVYQGRQEFRFQSMKSETPTDPLALLNYACTVTKGCGKAKAEKVWEEYGENYHARMAENKDTLNKLDRLLLDTLDDLKSDSENANATAFLMSQGASLHLAEQAVSVYGGDVVHLFKDNPYVLADLPRQSFKTIDGQFRERLGIALDADVRVRALLLYTIKNLAETTGDTVLSFGDIVASIDEHTISDKALENTLLSHTDDFVVLPTGGVTTKTLFKIEETIYKFARAGRTHSIRTSKKYITSSPHGIILDDSQVEAIENALFNTGLSIINGGAGCGKTTIIESIALSLEERDESFKIAAFAGKAAARIREATGYHASTIHSLLKYIPNIGFSAGDFENTTIIIDEASMVPAYLLAELCKRTPKRLILVGDEAQLPPVGAGAPFHVLVNQGFAKTVTTCYRNQEAIFQAAYAVRNGYHPVSARSEKESFRIYTVRNADEAQSLVENTLPHLDFDQDVIITPRNGEGENALPASVKRVNGTVLESLKLGRGDDGARIICLSNEPDLDVWNGTTGRILRTDMDGNVYALVDNDKQVCLPPKYFKESTAPAYALTIHKSQGSQYRRVVIVALYRDLMTLFDRSMLYTAITRAKEGCVVITDTNLLNFINKESTRKTVLQTFFEQETNE